jgi:hypothetical protein
MAYNFPYFENQEKLEIYNTLFNIQQHQILVVHYCSQGVKIDNYKKMKCKNLFNLLQILITCIYICKILLKMSIIKEQHVYYTL